MGKSIFDGAFESLKQGWNFSLPSLHGGSAVRKGIRNPFLTEAERERRETWKLYEEVKAAYFASPYAGADAAYDFMVEIGIEACEAAEITPSTALGEALYEVLQGLLVEEGAIFGFPEIEPSAGFTLEEGVTLRDYLNRKKRFLADHERLLGIWREKAVRVFAGVMEYLPATAFDADEEEAPAQELFAPLIELCDTPADLVERTMLTFFNDDVVNARLFDTLRGRFNRNALVASGIPPERQAESAKPIILPTTATQKSPTELVDAYLGGTPFAAFYGSRFPFRIPFPVRFEHSLVVGGTGHGKTQLLQLLIHQDLEASRKDGRSIVVIDSQGDLIRTVSHLSVFNPATAENLSDRLLIVDPNDVEYPVCLNMFDWNRERLGRMGPADREKILNGTIELYEYLFGALLGAELTQKQGVVFRYLARLMMEIPGATVHALRQLMENGEPFRQYMERLPPTARSFFETRFFDRSFNETKKQILTRLWGVLSNATLDRMFSAPKSKVDLFEATGRGKIVLINTAKDLLQQEGCAIFGRFFIALLAQAAMQRAALPAHERTPTFVYIDEAQDYFDQGIEQLLSQARKYRLGMVLAHQNLDQLPAGLRASVMANTSTKFAGGLSAKDAGTLAAEMRCDPAFLGAMRRRQRETEFACFVRNFTPQAVEVGVPLGYVDALPTLADETYAALVAANRARYCAAAGEIQDPIEAFMEVPAVEIPLPQPAVRSDQDRPRTEPPPLASGPAATRADAPDAGHERPRAQPSRSLPQAPPEPPPLGRGGARHKYLQQIIKQAAEERNIRATIEEPIAEGGRVDVALLLGDRRIACEVSVTTSRDQELGNVEKCLSAGYSEVVLVAASERQRANLQKFILPHLDEGIRDSVRFFTAEQVIGYLDEVASAATTSEGTLRGYRVRVTRKTVSEEDAKIRRQAIAQVIANSLKRG